VLLPKRITSEEIGDAVESIHRLAKKGHSKLAIYTEGGDHLLVGDLACHPPLRRTDRPHLQARR
jgi:hypothetical protein